MPAPASVPMPGISIVPNAAPPIALLPTRTLRLAIDAYAYADLVERVLEHDDDCPS